MTRKGYPMYRMPNPGVVIEPDGDAKEHSLRLRELISRAAGKGVAGIPNAIICPSCLEIATGGDDGAVRSGIR